MGTIRRPQDYVSGGTEATSFIQCVGGREPQIHEFWCLDLEGISRKFHPTARVEVTAGTAGEFLTNHLSENGRRIDIIWRVSVNDSVQFLGFSDQSGGRGLTFICNLLDCVEAIGQGSGKYSNWGWVGRLNGANSIKNFSWGASVNSCPAYLPQSHVNP